MLQSMLNLFIQILREVASSELFVIPFGVCASCVVISLFFRMARNRF